MPDDPREILKAVGAECVEVETFYGPHSYADEVDVSACFEEGDAAILAVARLVATQAGQLKQNEGFIALLKGMVEQLEGDEFEGGYDLDDLLKRVDESRK